MVAPIIYNPLAIANYQPLESELEEFGSRTHGKSKVGKETAGTPVGAAVMIVINLVVFIILTVAVAAEPVLLTDFGPFHYRQKYLVGLTLLATGCQLLSAGQLRRLWLQCLDKKLSGGHDLSEYNLSWRTTLSLGEFSESLKKWKIALSFIICVLSVSAITTGLSSNITTREILYEYTLPGEQDTNCLPVTSEVAKHSYSWKMNETSYMAVEPIMEFCPISDVLLLIGTLNILTPNDYGYGDHGVAVRPSALGAPGSFYASTHRNSTDLPQLSEKYGRHLLDVTGCASVLARNPFSCKRVNTIQFHNSSAENPAYPSVEVSSDGCQSETLILPPGPGSMEFGGFTFNICTSGEIGRSTLVIGHVGTDAIYAAKSMNDHEQRKTWEAMGWDYSLEHPMLYGVQCSVSPSFSGRILTLNRTGDEPRSGPFFQTLSGRQGCEVGNYGMDQMKATAAISPYPLLAAGWLTYLRGVLISTNYTNGRIRGPPYAFAESKNNLEDVLGLGAALALSKMTLTDAPFVSRTGKAIVEYTRVGPGKPWALVFCIAPLANIIILSVLWWMGRGKVHIITSSLVQIRNHTLRRYTSQESGLSRRAYSQTCEPMYLRDHLSPIRRPLEEKNSTDTGAMNS